MIKVNKIEMETAEFFGPDGKSLGLLNEFESNDLRLQIVQHEAIGYSVKFKDKTYTINEYGVIENWPKGLFELGGEQCYDLLKAQCELKDKKQNKK